MNIIFTNNIILCKIKLKYFFFADDTFDTSNEDKLSTGQMIIFIVGAGNFKGKQTSSYIIPTFESPNREPDTSVTQQTSQDQVWYHIFNLLNLLIWNYIFE